jgi:hypothetical protein
LVAIGFLIKLDIDVAETRVCRDKIQAGVNITVDERGDGDLPSSSFESLLPLSGSAPER